MCKNHLKSYFHSCSSHSSLGFSSGSSYSSPGQDSLCGEGGEQGELISNCRRSASRCLNSISIQMVSGETCLDIGPLDGSRLSRWQFRLDCTQVLMLILREPLYPAYSPFVFTLPLIPLNTSFNPHQPFEQHPWGADPLPFLWDPRWGPGLAGNR